ncbi:MAG: DUF296 domain-containing protein [archaeon]
MIQESEVFTQKTIKKELCVQLENDENVLDCVHQVIKENNLKECTLKSINGFLDSLKLNYFQGNTFAVKELHSPVKAISCSGTLRLIAGEINGDIKVSVMFGAKLLSGTLVKARAFNDLTIVLGFMTSEKQSKQKTLA